MNEVFLVFLVFCAICVGVVFLIFLVTYLRVKRNTKRQEHFERLRVLLIELQDNYERYKTIQDITQFKAIDKYLSDISPLIESSYNGFKKVKLRPISIKEIILSPMIHELYSAPTELVSIVSTFSSYVCELATEKYPIKSLIWNAKKKRELRNLMNRLKKGVIVSKVRLKSKGVTVSAKELSKNLSEELSDEIMEAKEHESPYISIKVAS